MSGSNLTLGGGWKTPPSPALGGKSPVLSGLKSKSMTGFLSLCSSFPREKFPQEVYCTIESWGDTHKRSVCLKSISGLLNH